ncbi:MauE/DoxX family redox-associated membrane protein [Sphingobacterium bambusae]|uniref:MauE/DoxX family redox-associated membrane protein n=1 Tax=Sphingobacterium bambusae TaxID=662858 RepID=A0ABW6BIZ6_9SPHI|nr:MauE/DoxX family redox-associated membrane protein [Sphingobacterium bambusae]WPL49416.1 hypothetical protein SCB77_02980 [Sphingobacterium bambusae]
MKNQFFITLFHGVLVFVFLYSALSKLLDFGYFKAELDKSPFLERWTVVLDYLIPLSEIIVVIMLLVKSTRTLALYLYLYMMSSFCFYVYLMMTKAHYLPCACMGLFGKWLSWEAHLLVNVFLLVLTILVILLNNKDSARAAHAATG